MGSLKTKMALGNEVLAAGDPKVEASSTPDEEEEEDLVDPVDAIKSQCEDAQECEKTKEILKICTERVSNAPPPEDDEDPETCEEELYDFLHCVDRCVSRSLFSKIK